MFESTLSLLSFIGAFYLYEGKEPKAFGSGNPSRVPSANYLTKDNKYVHVIANDRQWKTFCEASELEDMGNNPDYDTNAKRVEHRGEIDRRIQEKMLEKDSEEWVKIFDEKGLPIGAVRQMDEVFDDPQVIARKILIEMDHPRYGPIKTIALPFGFSSFKSVIKSPAPLLGEHSKEVLTDTLGYDEVSISQLVSDGVVRAE